MTAASLTALDARLRAVEDELAILRLVAAYGTLVDAGESAGVADLWTEDGVYEVDPEPLHGRDAVRAMVSGDAHQGLIRHGCGHLVGLPRVLVDGDTAVAIGHTQLSARSTSRDGFSVLRVTANRWELVREPSGWRVVRRIARVLDGSEAARALFVPPEATR